MPRRPGFRGERHQSPWFGDPARASLKESPYGVFVQGLRQRLRETMKPIKTWILIADGARARIVLNDGPGHGIKPGPDKEFEGVNLPDRDIVSDRPGRAFDSAGQGRHAMEPRSDPHAHEQRKLHHVLATYLDKEAKKGSFDRLVIVAPPKALGNLRAELSATVRAKVTGELNKDLTHVAIHDLAKHLGSVLAV